MKKLCIIIIGIVILVFMIIQCAGDQINKPSTNIDIEEHVEVEIPGMPYIEKCEREEFYKLAIPTMGNINTDSVFAWIEISKSGIDLMSGDVEIIKEAEFSNKLLTLYFHETDLLAGNYDYMIYLTDDENNIGINEKRTTSAGPYKLTIDYSQDFKMFCIEDIILQGDSTYFMAESIYCFVCQDEYYWQFSSSNEYQAHDQLNNFEIKDATLSHPNGFVKLDDNLFFPLKLSREGMEEPDENVSWILHFIRDRENIDGVVDDTAMALFYVDMPNNLGSTHNEFDTLICLLADKYAVPPQIVKGIMNREEARFISTSIRYEMEFDQKIMQPALDNKSHYINYHLADSARSDTIPGFDKYGNAVYQGDSIQYLSYDPYQILADWSWPGVFVRDDNHDGLITARELNNNNPNQNWFNPSYDFVAQIILSSSHGLMHVLHCSMIDYLEFGSQNPQELYDSDEVSLYWGIKNLSYIFYDAKYVDSNYDWDTKWRAAIGKYNGGRNAGENDGIFNNPAINDYVNNVLEYIDIYQPE